MQLRAARSRPLSDTDPSVTIDVTNQTANNEVVLDALESAHLCFASGSRRRLSKATIER
jgi:hypothetical protein